MQNRSSFFKNVIKEGYQITIDHNPISQASAPTFNVTIAMSTLAHDILKHATEYSSGSVEGVLFKINDSCSLSLSIDPGLGFEKSDLRFRNALALLTRYDLSTAKQCEIVEQYNSYLRANNLHSTYDSKTQQQSFVRHTSNQGY